MLALDFVPVDPQAQEVVVHMWAVLRASDSFGMVCDDCHYILGSPFGRWLAVIRYT